MKNMRGFSKFSPGIETACLSCGAKTYIFPTPLNAMRDTKCCIKCQAWTRYTVEDGVVRRTNGITE